MVSLDIVPAVPVIQVLLAFGTLVIRLYNWRQLSSLSTMLIVASGQSTSVVGSSIISTGIL